MQINLYSQEVNQSLPREAEARKSQKELQREMRNLWGVMEMFIILIVVMVSQVCTHAKPYQIEHFKFVHFIVG